MAMLLNILDKGMIWPATRNRIAKKAPMLSEASMATSVYTSVKSLGTSLIKFLPLKINRPPK